MAARQEQGEGRERGQAGCKGGWLGGLLWGWSATRAEAEATLKCADNNYSNSNSYGNYGNNLANSNNLANNSNYGNTFS